MATQSPTFLDLLEILRCPLCRGDSLEADEDSLHCPECGRAYRLDDGVLVMTREVASEDGAFVQELEDWEKNAEFYLREVESPLFGLLNMAKVRTYGLDREGRRLVVLDLGGGTGYFSQRLASWGHTAITLDFSGRMLRYGKKAYGLPLPLECASARLPFRDGSVDAVVANGVLHHCKAQHAVAETVREVHRVLKPGGLLLVYDRNGAFLGRHLHHFVMLVKRALERRGRFPSSSSTHEPDFNEADLRSILGLGFVVERRRYVSTLFTFMSIVVTNTVEYAGLRRLAGLLRVVCWPFAAATERVFPFKALTVEQCVRLRRT